MLAIGINDYKDPAWPDLKTPVNDVLAVRDILTQRYLFDGADVIQLLDEQATRRNIHAAFLQLKDQMGEHDSLLVYYAGHGSVGADGSGYWIPQDGGGAGALHTWMAHDEVRRLALFGSLPGHDFLNMLE